MADLVGVPKPSHDEDPIKVGVFTILTTTFFSLLGQGLPPREALTLTITLGLGGAEVIRRLPPGGGGRRRLR